MIGWCHFTTFVGDSSKFLNQWYLLCLVIDSYISSIWPEREAKWCSTWRSQLVTITLTLIALVVFLNISLTMTLFYVPTLNGTRPVCTRLHNFMPTLQHLDQIDVMLNVLVPLLLIIMLGIRILSREIRNIGSVANPSQSNYVVYVLVHISLWIPLQIVRVYNAFSNMAAGVAGVMHLSVRPFLWEQIVTYVTYTNIALNMVMLLCFHQAFRTYMKEKLTYLCCCRSWCCRLRTMHGTILSLNHNNDSDSHYSATVTVQTAFIETTIEDDV